MERESKIFIERGLLRRAGGFVREHLPSVRSCAIISDDTVSALYAQTLAKSLENAGLRAVSMAFAHGEASKNISTYAEVLNFLCENRLTRKDCIVALGGGVVGDLAGFAAATYLRGVHLVQIPTTLLACVDSSVGGKTAIDLPAGKNLCGAFYQPDIVLIDPETLSTLPETTFADGMAEVVKYAAIADPEIYALSQNAHENIDEIIRRCVDIKRKVVEQDERDTGLRQILNFGHTFGHAIEAKSNFAVTHGQGVAIGMAIMARACAGRGLCAKTDAQELISAIQAQNLPISTEYPPEELMDSVLSDKKRVPDGLTLVVMTGRGICRYEKYALSDVESMLREGWQAWT